MRQSTSAMQGHGVDEPEALAEALRRSRGESPHEPLAAPSHAAVAGGGVLAAVVEAAVPDDAMGGGEDEGLGRRPLRRQSAGARVLRAEFASMPPSSDAIPDVAFPGGVIMCPACQQQFYRGAPGFMRHLTTAHAGQAARAL